MSDRYVLIDTISGAWISGPLDEEPTAAPDQEVRVVPIDYGSGMEWSPSRKAFVDVIAAAVRLALVDFLFLFTRSERLAIRARRASDAILDDFWSLLEGATNGIRIDHPSVIAGSNI